MSRAFVRDQDADGLEDLPDRLISEHPNDVTERGLEQIEAAVATARDALAVAQSAGDRSKMARASRDLRYWSARRATARVIPDPDTVSEVRFGSTLTIARDDGRQQTYRIVGEDEADPARGSISHASPLARALFGKGIGDTATLTNGGSRSSASNSHSGLVMARLCNFACWQPRKCYFSAGEMNVRSKLFDAGRRNDLKAAESRRGSLDKAFKVGERGTAAGRPYYPLQLLGIAMYVNFYVRPSVRKGFMRRSLCEGVD